MKKPTPDQACYEAEFDLADKRPEIERAEAALVEAVESCGYERASVFAVRLAFEEAVLNAFRHGHRGLPGRPVRVSWRIEPARVEITITDQGPGFDPRCLPDPTLDENLEKPCGRGIMLMRAYMSEVTFNEAGNRVVMIYKRPPGRAATG